jgi:hypothetical protein
MRRSIRLALPAALAAFAWGAAAAAQTSGAVTLSPGFLPDPQRLAGMSGGPVQASTLNPSCRGWIAQQPNHAINVAVGFSFLRTFVEAASDTTLVIRAPNGQFFCADDTYGTNPGIDAAYGPGTYYVWVGSYSQNSSGPYSIAFTELRSTRPAGAVSGTTPSTTTPLLAPVGGRDLSIASGPGGAIFDNHTTTSTALVTQPCTIQSLSVTVRGRHSFNSDLTLRLRAPNGESETLQSHASRNPFRRYTTSHFVGLPAVGTWTLSVTDDVNADSGVLNGFALNLRCQ